jgi:hypothetical protein
MLQKALFLTAKYQFSLQVYFNDFGRFLNNQTKNRANGTTKWLGCTLGFKPGSLYGRIVIQGWGFKAL